MRLLVVRLGIWQIVEWEGSEWALGCPFTSSPSVSSSAMGHHFSDRRFPLSLSVAGEYFWTRFLCICPHSHLLQQFAVWNLALHVCIPATQLWRRSCLLDTAFCVGHEVYAVWFCVWTWYFLRSFGCSFIAHLWYWFRYHQNYIRGFIADYFLFWISHQSWRPDMSGMD
jgi:hypothetical protein